MRFSDDIVNIIVNNALKISNHVLPLVFRKQTISMQLAFRIAEISNNLIAPVEYSQLNR